MNPESESSKTFIPANSIAYVDGSVVSKTILKKSTGNITLFAFDKGEGLSEHTTPHEALIQVLDGEAEITIGGTVHHVPQGACLLLPPNLPHAVKANERFKMMLVMIKS